MVTIERAAHGGAPPWQNKHESPLVWPGFLAGQPGCIGRNELLLEHGVHPESQRVGKRGRVAVQVLQNTIAPWTRRVDDEFCLDVELSAIESVASLDSRDTFAVPKESAHFDVVCHAGSCIGCGLHHTDHNAFRIIGNRIVPEGRSRSGALVARKQKVQFRSGNNASARELSIRVDATITVSAEDLIGKCGGKHGGLALHDPRGRHEAGQGANEVRCHSQHGAAFPHRFADANQIRLLQIA